MNTLKTINMFHPFMAPKAQERVMDVLHTPMIGQGKIVDDFEDAIKNLFGLSYVVAVNNSSSAIRLALDICGVKPGDEVVTTPMTCTLTNHPILEQFALPIFSDIQFDTGNIDPIDVEKRITPRTKAIICAHWAGTPCDLDELNVVAKKNNLAIIEDASEAFGASYHGNSIGIHSRFVAFSFHAIQIITAGEGGALSLNLSNDNKIAQMKRWFGIDRLGRCPNILGYYDFDVTTIGYGYYLTNIAAALGMENLTTITQQQSHRKQIADIYRNSLNKIPGITLLKTQTDRSPSYHYFTIHVENREEFCRMMNAAGVKVSIVHARNDLYSIFGGLRSDLPNLDQFSKKYINLPIHMGLTLEDVHYVVSTIKSGW